MRPLLFLCLVAFVATAGPDAPEDVKHPRSPESPLTVVFTPWYCTQCVKEERCEARDGPFSVMHMDLMDFAKHCDLDKKWLYIETKNFKIVSTLGKSKIKFKHNRYARGDIERLKTIFPKLKPGRDGILLNAHQRAHLYHIRAERVYGHFAALTDNKKPWLGMQGHYQLFLLDDFNEYHTFADDFVGRAQKLAGVQQHVKEKPNFNMFATSEQQVSRTKGKGDSTMQNWFVHNLTHLFIDGYNNYYRETWAWLEEGLAHYYEKMENPRHNTFCFAEGAPPKSFLKPDWRPIIYGLVRRGKDPGLARWCEKLQPGELSGTENGMTWSIVEWLVETEPVRFTKLLNELNDYKAKQNASQCIQKAFGVTPSVLHERWRKYVLDTYK